VVEWGSRNERTKEGEAIDTEKQRQDMEYAWGISWCVSNNWNRDVWADIYQVSQHQKVKFGCRELAAGIGEANAEKQIQVFLKVAKLDGAD
jgi:hypothetical protein